MDKQREYEAAIAEAMKALDIYLADAGMRARWRAARDVLGTTRVVVVPEGHYAYMRHVADALAEADRRNQEAE